MMGDIGERHLLLALIAQNIRADAVADENDIDAGLDFRPGGRRVIGGQHRDFLDPALHLEKTGGFAHFWLIFIDFRQARLEPAQARARSASAIGPEERGAEPVNPVNNLHPSAASYL